MTIEGARCGCGECRALDALPERLQGWPGAWQSTLLHLRETAPRREIVSLPTFETDKKLRNACAERCATVGDPPCWAIIHDPKPCGECFRDAGVEPGDEFDEAAAIGRML